MEPTLDLLKLRLLLDRLERASTVTVHSIIIREAELSWRQAAEAGFSSLLFPCLFEERTQAALEEAERRRERYWESVVRSSHRALPI